MSSSANKSFDRRGVIDYEKRRYRGLDQRLVDRREKKILNRELRRLVTEKEGKDGTLPVLLDAPCGFGRFTGLLLGLGARLVSCDLSFPMVERALENEPDPRHMGGAVADVRGRLPFHDGAFSVVVSMRLFHHLREENDRKAVLGEFARVARDGAVLSFYRAGGLHKMQRRIRKLFKKSQRKIKMLPGRTFENEAEAAGFSVVRIVPLFPGLHAQRIAVLKKK